MIKELKNGKNSNVVDTNGSGQIVPLGSDAVASLTWDPKARSILLCKDLQVETCRHREDNVVWFRQVKPAEGQCEGSTVSMGESDMRGSLSK